MTRIIMNGCNGKMGQMISELVAPMEGVEIVAGIDLNTTSLNGYPVYATLEDCTDEADVIIDFSVAKVVDQMIDTACAKKLPVVLCTTGLTEEQLKHVRQASEQIAILRSANMSLGINMLMKLLKQVAATLVPEGFDVEIVEKHHNQKLDAPSGTALALADSINEEMGNTFEYVYDRSQVRQKRGKNELGLSAVRGGSIVGEHEVIFAGIDEVITISHTAYSKALFAKGAIAAARYLADQKPGMYDMSNVIEI